MATKEKDLSEIFVHSVNLSRPKKSGAGTFEFTMCDDEILGDVKYVLLTGNEPFDTFIGGFPFGRISEVFGLENCGKTAMMIRAMCRFQAKHIYEVTSKDGFIATLKRVDPSRIRLIKAYIDNEGSLEKGFKITIHDTSYDAEGNEMVENTAMEKTGIGLCDTIEQVFLAVDKFLKVIENAEREDEDLDEDERKVIFGLFIVDTIAGTSSKDEIERDWGERDYPRAAGKISEGFRRLRGEISRRNVALICTNQVRTQFKDYQGSGYKARFGTPQVSDFSTFGGRALSFYATHRIFMFQLPVKYTLVKGAQFPAGYLIGFRTHKTRLRKGGREGRMVLLFDEELGGLHNSLSILETMLFLNAAELHDGGQISFRFHKFGLETATFAENVKLKDDQRRRVRDPEIEDRYEWLSFYKAHRSDLDRLWQAAVEKANSTEGLHAFSPEQKEEDDDYQEPPPRRTSRHAARVLRDKDADDV
jgi:RecA/RadA recombinase